MSIPFAGLLSRILRRFQFASPAPAASTKVQTGAGSLTEKMETVFRDQYPRVFAVISWGLAASEWLCKVLNAHPEVLAVHGIHYSVDPYLPSGRPLTECHSLKMVRDLGKGYGLAGDVHGIPGVDNLPDIQREFGDSFRFAILTRDPERRLLSLAGLFEQLDYDERIWNGLEYLQTMPNFARVSHYYKDRKSRFFMHGANMLNKILDETRYFPIVRCEDLTTDPEALVRLIHHLSAGRITASLDWARSMIALPRTNRHKKPSGHTELQDWQVEIMRAMVKPESCQAYERIGYSLPESWSTARHLSPRQRNGSARIPA